MLSCFTVGFIKGEFDEEKMSFYNLVISVASPFFWIVWGISKGGCWLFRKGRKFAEILSGKGYAFSEKFNKKHH
jgi:hypothetical protein